MLNIGVQSRNIIYDEKPLAGFELIKSIGFSCTDFSLNGYLHNTDIYTFNINRFFDKSANQLEDFFTPHKSAAKKSNIAVNQMHMPYPIYVPGGNKNINTYLLDVVAKKSIGICSFFECKNIVVHGIKLAHILESEEEEWKQTEKALLILAPLAKEAGVTICLENIYTNTGGKIVEGPCCDALKICERIEKLNDQFKQEVFGFCFDTGHANLVGIDFEKFITQLGYHLKVLHIHDNDGVADLHQIPFTFTKTRENTSSTDWSGFINGLKNINFKGVLSFETAPVLKSFPTELMKTALNTIWDIGRYFAAKIE